MAAVDEKSAYIANRYDSVLIMFVTKRIQETCIKKINFLKKNKGVFDDER